MRGVTLTKKKLGQTLQTDFNWCLNMLLQISVCVRACVLLCIEMCNQLNWSQPAHVHVERRLRAEIRAVCARRLISD